jgi:hypothetical protein
LPQQFGEHGILQHHQAIGMELHRHVAIAEVIRGLKQSEGIRAAHLHHRLRSGLHLDLQGAVLAEQTFTWPQGGSAGQLQQQVTATGGAPMTAQAGAFISRQKQLQRLEIHGRGHLIRQTLH